MSRVFPESCRSVIIDFLLVIQIIGLRFVIAIKNQLYFVLLMKSHLESYPCPLIINSFWNVGFLLGITIIFGIIKD